MDSIFTVMDYEEADWRPIYDTIVKLPEPPTTVDTFHKYDLWSKFGRYNWLTGVWKWYSFKKVLRKANEDNMSEAYTWAYIELEGRV